MTPTERRESVLAELTRWNVEHLLATTRMPSRAQVGADPHPSLQSLERTGLDPNRTQRDGEGGSDP